MASSSQVAMNVKENNNTSGPNWLELPREITAKIFNKLEFHDLSKGARLVCSLWLNISNDPLTCRILNLTNVFDSHNRSDIQKCLDYAYDLISHGHLLDINIPILVNDSIIEYIAESSSQLRRLGIANCINVTDKGLSGVANRLSLLEELNLSFCFLNKVSLEAIGSSCPFLKVLKFNRSVCKPNGDEEAFAIAKTMPNLCKLELMGTRLTNDGLVAILDCCSQLEYLDLRGCCNLDLHARLRKRCDEQIKDIRLPNDFKEPFLLRAYWAPFNWLKIGPMYIDSTLKK